MHIYNISTLPQYSSSCAKFQKLATLERIILLERAFDNCLNALGYKYDIKSSDEVSVSHYSASF